MGFNLVKTLISKKHKVTVIDNLQRKKKLNIDQIKLIKHNSLKFYKFDISKPIKIKKNNFDIIYNFAAILGVKKVSKNPFDTFNKNLEITKNLIYFCKKQKNCKFINFSSSEVYSNLIFLNRINYPTPENLNLTFLHKTISRDSYGLSKFITEKMCEFSNINFINIRPHNIYGPDMGYAHVVPELIYKIYKNKKVKVFSHNHKRAFCYIDDAIDQIVKLSLKKNIKKETINIGNPTQEINMYNLANKINVIMNNKAKIKKNIKITIGSPHRRVPSLSKFQRMVGKIDFTSLNDGLKKTVNWYINDIRKNRK